LRAELHLQEINYLLHPEQEPVMALDEFDRYVRQSMVVDLEQFCEAPWLPEVERGYVRSVVEPISEEEMRAEVVAALHDEEPESPFALAHDEDFGGWSARIEDCLVECGGSMGFWSIVEVTGLAPVEVLLGLLLGGLSIKWGAKEFYGVPCLSIEPQRFFPPERPQEHNFSLMSFESSNSFKTLDQLNEEKQK
jgi:hypothetical protein